MGLTSLRIVSKADHDHFSGISNPNSEKLRDCSQEMEMSNTASDPITGYTAIHTGDSHESLMRFSSAEAIYVEALHAGHWSGRYWSADGRINVPYESWAEDAFRVMIDGKPIDSGWQVVSAREAARNERGARHFVVELTNSEHPLGLKVHTLLDGTAVLTRWLEISNLSEKPTALNHLSVWAGRMWPGQYFTLGYYGKDSWASEGWLKFEWQSHPAAFILGSVSCVF